MRKIIGFVGALFFIVSCQKDNDAKNEKLEEVAELSEISQRCASQEVLEQQLATDPNLRQRMLSIEENTQNILKNKSQYRLLSDDVTIEIPVIVHVIYKTAAENISLAQIESQIAVLTEDFTKTNADHTKVPENFVNVKSDVQIKFVLDRVVRKSSAKKSWSTNDDMKFASKGGSNAITPQKYLNIWVVNKMQSFGSTILGYAQFPGGNWATDGVVIGYNFFGRVGTLSAPYNKGRTATHEVGHWLNLRHIWGDATCGDDQVGDTPQHNTSNGGCPSVTHRSTCEDTPLEMWMNYMDYTYDQCMYMFTNGQKNRMRTVFTSSGFRNALVQP